MAKFGLIHLNKKSKMYLIIGLLAILLLVLIIGGIKEGFDSKIALKMEIDLEKANEDLVNAQKAATPFNSVVENAQRDLKNAQTNIINTLITTKMSVNSAQENVDRLSQEISDDTSKLNQSDTSLPLLKETVKITGSSKESAQNFANAANADVENAQTVATNANADYTIKKNDYFTLYANYLNTKLGSDWSALNNKYIETKDAEMAKNDANEALKNSKNNAKEANIALNNAQQANYEAIKALTTAENIINNIPSKLQNKSTSLLKANEELNTEMNDYNTAKTIFSQSKLTESAGHFVPVNTSSTLGTYAIQ